MSRKKKQAPPELHMDAAEARSLREQQMLEKVGYRKVKIEDLEKSELERQADKLLAEQDHDLLLRLVESTEAIRQGMESLKLPSNDPEYLKRLQTAEAARNAIANKIAQVDLVPDGNKTYIGVGSFNHYEARELAEQLANHFEAKLRAYDPQ